jgi:serine/threonine protein kinase
MLGRYELLATIGVGGMASVILARQKGPAGFEKAVVIKLIHPHMAQDTVAVNMLLDEAKVAAQLDHQNIVHTYELGEAHGTYYIVMEYLAGESLGQVLKQGQKQNSPMTPFVAAKIVAEAAEGLHYAHELPDFNGAPMGIVHRDVSPGNIVVQYNGAVKVVDFGIAKAQGRVTSTQDGELKGKYGYMSPEQIKNDVMDRRSDVFSLGVVLWESLARRRLFNADNVAATLMQILQGDRTPPSAYDADIPHALDAVALRALAPNPSDRFQTVAEMKQAIDDAIWKSRVGGAEIQAQMLELFSDRIESRKTMLARATQNALSVGDLEVLGTAFRDPASQPSRPASMMTPTSGVSQVTAPRTALPDREAPSDRSAEALPPPPAVAPPSWAPPAAVGRPLNLPAIAPAPNLPPPTIQRASVPNWGPPSELIRPSSGEARPPVEEETSGGMHKLVVILVAGAILGIVLGIFVGVSGGKKSADKAAVPKDEPTVAMKESDGSATPSISEAMTTTSTTPVTPPPGPTITQINPPPAPPRVVEDPVTPPTPNEPTFKPIKPPPTKPAIAPKPPDEPLIKKPVKPVVDEPDEAVVKKVGSEAELYKKGADAYMAGDFTAAEAAYKQALVQNRGYAPAHRGLGFLYQRMGESGKALQSLRTYLKLTPNAKDGAAIRKRIQQLGGE